MKKLVQVAGLLSFVFCTLPVASALTLSGDALSIDAPTTENVYIMGGSIAINGPVEGDIVALSGDILINAPVSGDVLVAGGTVTIQSDIGGDIRIASSQLALTKSRVQGDIVYAGSRVSMDSLSSASGSLMIQTGQGVFQGSTSGTIDIRAADLTFGGLHSGPVHIQADTLQFLGDSKVAGDVTYTANTVRDSAALTAATVTVEELPTISWPDTLETTLTVGISIFLATLLLLLLLVRTAPLWSMDVTHRMHKKGPSSIFLGLFLLMSLPSVIAFLLGLQIVWAPWAVILLPATLLIATMAFLLVMLSPAVIALFFARLLPMRDGEPLPLWISLPVGALITAVLISLPYIGLFAGAWLLILAVGAMAQTQTRFLGIFEKRISSQKKDELSQ